MPLYSLSGQNNGIIYKHIPRNKIKTVNINKGNELVLSKYQHTVQPEKDPTSNKVTKKSKNI